MMNRHEPLYRTDPDPSPLDIVIEIAATLLLGLCVWAVLIVVMG